MITLKLTEWELRRIIEKMKEGGQEHIDRDLMMKLWDKERKLKKVK